MKKTNWTYLVAQVVTLSVAAAGCAQKEEPAANDTAPAPAEAVVPQANEVALRFGLMRLCDENARTLLEERAAALTGQRREPDHVQDSGHEVVVRRE